MVTSAPIQEVASLWRDPELDDMEFLHGVYTRHAFAPHFHRTYVVEVVEQGVDVLQCDQAVHSAPAGSIIICNPFEVHTGRPGGSRPLEYRSFYPSVELWAGIVRRKCGRDAWPHFAQKVIHDPELFEALRSAHIAIERWGGASARAAVESALAAAALRHGRLRPREQLRAAMRDEVRRLCDHIDRSHHDTVTLDCLTRIANLSPFHLIRVFRRETGLTPHEYLVNIRVEHARALLAAGRPIAEAARSAGFFDQSHLTRHFKRITGVTPGRYLRTA
jgi:AraC-like DNA-binding protein